MTRRRKKRTRKQTAALRRKIRAWRKKNRKKNRKRKRIRKHSGVKRARQAKTISIVSPVFLIRHRSQSTPGKVYDRTAVVVSVGGKHVAFYQSTGTGTPGLVSAGSWVPFNGISRAGGGWFVKMPGKAPTGKLKTAAQWLKRELSGKRPATTFDEADYSSRDSHSADVNRYLDKYGALYSSGGGPFVQGTINVRKAARRR